MDDTRLEQLIRQIHQGDQDALSLVYIHLGKSIYYLAFALTSDSYLSQDVLQETILRVWEHSGQYQPGTRPRAWIYTIARHVTMDMIRRQDQSISLDKYLESMPDIPCEKGRGLDAELNDRLDLDAALKLLDRKERTIVILKNFGGLSHIETSKVLQMPYGTVLWKYSQAIRKLRQLMDGQQGRELHHYVAKG